jgi:hypothetical protein
LRRPERRQVFQRLVAAAPQVREAVLLFRIQHGGEASFPEGEIALWTRLFRNGGEGDARLVYGGEDVAVLVAEAPLAGDDVCLRRGSEWAAGAVF